MKKYLILSLFVFVLVVVGVVGVKVFAETEITTLPSPVATTTPPLPVPAITPPTPIGITSPMVLTISANGHILIRGVVESVGTDSLTIKSWGGSWTVKLSSTTNTMSANRVISDFQIGDFVGVMGTVEQDGSFIINAQIVRKWLRNMDFRDHDKDGIPDNQDEDDDNDGILDVNDSKSNDHDNDSISDEQDTDDDNDGLLDDSDSKSGDHDNDGISDSQDDNDDGDDNSGNGNSEDDDIEDENEDDNSNSGNGNGNGN